MVTYFTKLSVYISRQESLPAANAKVPQLQIKLLLCVHTLPKTFWQNAFLLLLFNAILLVMDYLRVQFNTTKIPHQNICTFVKLQEFILSLVALKRVAVPVVEDCKREV